MVAVLFVKIHIKSLFFKSAFLGIIKCKCNFSILKTKGDKKHYDKAVIKGVHRGQYMMACTLLKLVCKSKKCICKLKQNAENDLLRW